MIAVCQIAGHQALVKVGSVIEAPHLHREVGEIVHFPVLLCSKEDGSDFQLGKGTIEGLVVKAKICENYLGDKILVYKMVQRKRYRKTRGHRTHFTKIEVIEIGKGEPSVLRPVSEESVAAKAANAAKPKKAAPKAEAPVKATPKKAPAKKPAKKAE